MPLSLSSCRWLHVIRMTSRSHESLCAPVGPSPAHPLPTRAGMSEASEGVNKAFEALSDRK
eukprot:12213913-Heterocapsa_arctica.AAC.1